MSGIDDRDRADARTVTREFDTTQEDPNVAVVSALAEIEDVPVEELTPLYSCIDHILEHLYSNPPADEADVRITFTYNGYRITVEQDGRARFEPLEDDRLG
ncbi:HalOD1 output domain-containing protein [Halovivax cerinus]|uniref:HalOD1 output domain-containing protein n=1 Tax=Halovivax cerinus TaxID=1487865 RepID=A0ABD5NQJ6_9EURY|nr:HalOD1 output domain-containing protein [Halovivax cerinus]